MADPTDEPIGINSATLRGFNPTNNQIVDDIKKYTDRLVEYISINCPENRCRNISIVNYQQAAMWAVRSNFDNN